MGLLFQNLDLPPNYPIFGARVENFDTSKTLLLLYKLYPKQIGLFPLIDKIIAVGGDLLGHTVCKLGYIKNSLPFQ